MLFKSIEFVYFLIGVVVLYWAIPFRLQNGLLLIGSYFFYGWWGFFTPELTGFGRVLPLLLLWGSSLATYLSGKYLHPLPEGSRRRRVIFWLGVGVNVAMLGYFKYRGFFIENVQAAAEVLGWRFSTTEYQFLLPAGISFYTFQGLAYLIDVYGGFQKPAHRLYDYALFHAYFPQLVAGPIERTNNLLPQLTAPRSLTPERLWSGLQLLIIGYVKKVAIADAIAPMTDRAFDPAGGQSGFGLLIGLYLFALQIYGDFSGYSDIARGVSRLLGIELMINFRQPYFSKNITEFWERWHISLSSWLRDYLFIPLCRRFRGKRLIYLNLFLTMVISGIWHGASWNFVLWGVALGVFLLIHKWWTTSKTGKRIHKMMPTLPWISFPLGIFLTFNAVCFTLIFVKTRTLTHAWSFIKGIAAGGSTPPDLIPLIYFVCYGTLVALIDYPCWRTDRELPVPESAPSWKRGVVFGSLLLLLTFLGEMKGVSFVYFQF